MFPFTEEKNKWADYGEMIRYRNPQTCIFQMVSSLNDSTTLLSLWYIDIIRLMSVYPANTGHWRNVVWMLGRCRRRRANNKTTMGQFPVFAGFLYTSTGVYIYIFSPTFGQCLGNDYVASLTMSRNCTSFEISVCSCVQYFPVHFLRFARLQPHFVWIIGLALTVCLLG